MRKITIAHLYSKNLNIYGDIGNIICLKYRLKKRGYETNIVNYNLGDSLFPINSDIFFIGGGEDKDQMLVCKDLLKHKKAFKRLLKNGIILLAICGGYQLLGKRFVTGDGNIIKGLELFDLETKSPDLNVKSRCIGNIATQLNPEFLLEEGLNLKTLVGFENHSGQTFLGSDTNYFGTVLSGFGNSITTNTEGAYKNNFFGTYLHGSFLPKNPHFADYLIKTAIKNKYGRISFFPEIDDSEELKAHKYILNNILSNNK